MLRTSKEPPEDVILESINTWSTLDVDGYDEDRSRCTRYTGCRVGMKPRKDVPVPSNPSQTDPYPRVRSAISVVGDKGLALDPLYLYFAPAPGSHRRDGKV